MALIRICGGGGRGGRLQGGSGFRYLLNVLNEMLYHAFTRKQLETVLLLASVVDPDPVGSETFQGSGYGSGKKHSGYWELRIRNVFEVRLL